MLTNDPNNPSCTREPCEHAETGQIEAWPAHGFESGGLEFIEITFCVAGLGSEMGNETLCEMDVPFSTNGHQYEFEANDLNGHQPAGVFTPRCELTGHWLTEAADSGQGTTAIEVTHL